MSKSVDFNKYLNFVDGVTSDPSKDYKSFIASLELLDREGSNINRLTTAAVGISAEGGEFMEIVKKMVFQGKPWNDDNREHLIIELGDVMWYVMQACATYQRTSPNSIIRCSRLSSFQGFPWKIIFLTISINSPPSALIPTAAVRSL